MGQDWLLDVKPLHEPMLTYYGSKQTSVKFESKCTNLENPVENVVCKIAAMFSRPQWFNYFLNVFCYVIRELRLGIYRSSFHGFVIHG